MQAMHGVQAKHATSDAAKIAFLFRGGMLPQAQVYPAARRATPALRMYLTHLMRQPAELLAHVYNANSQYNVSEIGTKIASKANRDGVAERCDAAAVQKTIKAKP
jgi:hypothetical protein